MDASFANENWNIAVSAGIWGFASYWCWVGAMRGMIAHRVPRVVLSIGCTFIMMGLMLRMFHVLDATSSAEMVRVSGWVVAIGIAWSAITGIKAGRQMRDNTTRLNRLEQLIDTVFPAKTDDDDD